MTSPYHIFLSHRSLDRPWVECLAHNLQARDYRVFLDAWELIPGRPFHEIIFEAINQARKGILVATSDAIDSGWVRVEYEAMLRRSRSDPDFHFVPLVFGKIPELPFLDNVHCVDFRDASNKAYRRAFYELLCGLEGRAPGDGTFDGDLEFPAPPRSVVGHHKGGERRFVEDVFTTLASTPVLMLLAQENPSQHGLIDAILKRARKRFGTSSTLHITPPYSEWAELEEYFGRLGRQCGLENIRGPVDWDDALDRLLNEDANLFLLISGFENGSAAGRRELAGVLRSLVERNSWRLRVVLCGGERLAELKYGAHEMSLLNIAEVHSWPELTVDDVVAWQVDFPGAAVDLDIDQARALLDICGGHPHLVRYLLQHRQGHPTMKVEDYRQALRDYGFTWQLFTPYLADDKARARICSWLERDDLGSVVPWQEDELLRRLYWSNVLVGRERRLRWRCEVLREVGLKVLGCSGSSESY